DYWNFKANFRARLERLKRIYSTHKDYKAILTQVNEIANPKNWDGAFAELAAFGRNFDGNQKINFDSLNPEDENWL
ncbi:MAG: hypothetical protein ACK419_07465, partial [Pyrinomonadaceae bacterium]